MTLGIIVNKKTVILHELVDDPTVHSLFAKRLRVARETSGLTQQAAAERIGISLRTYAAYEGGKKFPELKRLPNVAGALGVSVGFLFENLENKGEKKSPEESLIIIRQEIAYLEHALKEKAEIDVTTTGHIDRLQAELAAAKVENLQLRKQLKLKQVKGCSEES